MSWKKWRRGLLIAAITGAATGAIGLSIGVTWHQTLILFGVSIGKDLLLYLKDHPIEQIEDTTAFIKRARELASTPPETSR